MSRLQELQRRVGSLSEDEENHLRQWQQEQYAAGRPIGQTFDVWDILKLVSLDRAVRAGYYKQDRLGSESAPQGMAPTWLVNGGTQGRAGAGHGGILRVWTGGLP